MNNVASNCNVTSSRASSTGFCHVYKPVLDDAPFRAFATMKAYREWCARDLPHYLGYDPAPIP